MFDVDAATSISIVVESFVIFSCFRRLGNQLLMNFRLPWRMRYFPASNQRPPYTEAEDKAASPSALGLLACMKNP